MIRNKATNRKRGKPCLRIGRVEITLDPATLLSQFIAVRCWHEVKGMTSAIRRNRQSRTESLLSLISPPVVVPKGEIPRANRQGGEQEPAQQISELLSRRCLRSTQERA